MYPFHLVRTSDAHTAAREGLSAGTKYIAGGTNLLDLMKLDIETPARLIDINDLPLNQIEVLGNGNIRIGALVKNTDLAYHPEVLKRFPFLSEAILSGASPQLRNMATTGGNVLQRTRCYYFYDPAFPCNKRVPGSGCPAIGGFNRNHAVLGTSGQCIATHPSDMCVAMAAIDPLVHLQGPAGARSIAFSDLHRLPGNTPHIETNLHAGELITAVELPHLPFAVRTHYLKVRDRTAFEFALASAAVALEISGGTVRQARIALGGVATKPWRSHEAEKVLIGSPAGDSTYKRAADAALAGAATQQYNSFKPELARRALIRALTITEGLA